MDNTNPDNLMPDLKVFYECAKLQRIGNNYHRVKQAEYYGEQSSWRFSLTPDESKAASGANLIFMPETGLFTNAPRLIFDQKAWKEKRRRKNSSKRTLAESKMLWKRMLERWNGQ